MLRAALIATLLAISCCPSIAASLTEKPSPTVNLFMPGLTSDDDTYYGAAIAAKPSATTYLVGCYYKSNADCGPFTVAQGHLSYSMGWAQGGTMTQKLDCIPDDTTSLSCHLTTSTYAPGSSTVSGSTITQISGSDVNYVPVTITAGQEMVTDSDNAAPPRPTAWAAAGGVAMAVAAAVAPV